ncbi:helix-turn-helix domain-containing protein (plasmid) [Ruegeria conchae]|uniref:arsenate reductase/protein-tyrosine-phosphatase family protein n=1 Tax=Ruegeria conchae TaxID=981384 RepID=UPI001480C4E6|nr:helix-turn-helix domain-containing protein [Ruegeria conchae]UWR05482.1 helix-turn-helix domain-containing protein [Ruegeria conchae]
MESYISNQLNTLGHPHRLAVFRILMRRYPDRVPAGELGSALDIKPSTMSSYLSALQNAQIINQQRVGTSLLYSIDMHSVREMLDYLFLDCCLGRPDLCMPFDLGIDVEDDRKFNVLFLCVGNSARSIFAESLLREIAGDRFNVFSAGIKPSSELNPFALQVLKDKGHDISALRSKNIAEFSGSNAPDLDFVFTVCNQAANEECPAWDGQPISGHWGMADPVKAEGTHAEKSLAFQNAYGALKRRIEAFSALPVESLDRLALQSAIDEIGKSAAESTT